jgi:hypothetical protein
MKLLIQPRDGVARILAAIKRARTGIEVLICRFDRDDVERALHAAIGRGVQVHALVKEMIATFEGDWAQTELGRERDEERDADDKGVEPRVQAPVPL